MPGEEIYDRILELRKSLDYLKKDSKGHQYNYVSSESVLTRIREKMNELGIVVIPNIHESNLKEFYISSNRKDAPQKHLFMTELVLTYNIICADIPDDYISIPWRGYGVDDFEKGIGKALTYAEKYLFLKLLQIPTGKDDPDSRQNQTPKRSNGYNEDDELPF